ncbi:MAG: alanine--tRNA ligase [Oscillospiraceae bacterium]|nr:alanine--tRNA ligase [Oscillospiraceae bacterium]
MKFTGLNELRESYLAFFEGKGHLRLDSAPLVPKDDNSILLINAGMTPLKKYFQGIEEPPRKRAASCQKCIRTPDIDNVGITARHGTFFEMLGNFSFGDYFKSDACKWAWEYFTEVLQIPSDLLWISVYEEDDEAESVWINEVGIPPERVVKFGKADNFWEHGSGPCGPCSEIYFDRGVENGCSPDCKVGCDCDRYIEVWNLVFTQFDSDGKGNYSPLASKNIDTGMGLERLACVMQGANNLFEVDTIKSVIEEIERVSGVKYNSGGSNDVSIRVITDHVRSSTFMICDGVLPSNEGRGYVLRRLLRRAARHGRLIGIKELFLYELCDKVIESSKSAYPELAEKQIYIKKTIQTEEESFAKTVEKGMSILMERIDSLSKGEILNGEDAFKLHDTFGFPLDLTKEILAEKGLVLDEEKFAEKMKEQRDTARANQSFKGGWGDGQLTIDNERIAVEFVGEELTENIETKILAVIKNGEEVESCSAGEEVMVVLEKTPFYAESGGQIGDKGLIWNDCENNLMAVSDTKKIKSGQSVCYATVERGTFNKNDTVDASFDFDCRSAIQRNHTAAHLLQAAMRFVLGEHVHQAGSLVDENRCRFDFTHGQALNADEVRAIENEVNCYILANEPVVIKEMPIDEAKKIGATALFGEKYGDVVRVVKIGDVSTELCGGTHVKNIGEIGLFKIVSESSVASGVRRIEAVTGWGVLGLFKTKQEEVEQLQEKFKASNSASQKEIARLNAIIANMQAKSAVVEEVGNSGGIKLLVQKIPGADANALRQSGDKLKDAYSGFAAVLAGESNFLCVCDPAAVEAGLKAGEIVREIAVVTGGKGGGRADSAMAGIGDNSRVDAALSKFAESFSK